jgi:hypothetical protein
MLLADQVEQQVERTFERFEEDLERIRRDVQIGRQREQRLAIKPGQGDAIDYIRRAVSRRFGKRRCDPRIDGRFAGRQGIRCGVQLLAPRVVDVAWLGQRGFVEAPVQLRVEVLVPEDRTPCTLVAHDRGIFLLQFADELGRVGDVAGGHRCAAAAREH